MQVGNRQLILSVVTYLTNHGLIPGLSHGFGASAVSNTAPPFFPGHVSKLKRCPQRGQETGVPAAKHRAAFSQAEQLRSSMGVTAHASAGKMQLTGESLGKEKRADHLYVQPPQPLAARTNEGGKRSGETGATTTMGRSGNGKEHPLPRPVTEKERPPACGLLHTAAREGEVRGRDEGEDWGCSTGKVLGRQWWHHQPWSCTRTPTTQHTRRQTGPAAQEEDCGGGRPAKRAWNSCVSSNTSTLSCSLGRSSSSVSNLNGSSATGSSPGS